MTAEPPTLPSADRIQGLLDGLDDHAALRGTLAIHDPLYQVLADASDANLSALAAALDQYPKHPAVSAIRDAFGDTVVSGPRTLQDVLRKHGPLLAGVDPLDEVDQRLARAVEVERVLRRRIADVEAVDRLLNRNANALAAVGAILAMFALIGWLIALGEWDVDWMDAPAPPEEGAGVPAGSTR